jgi:integrase
VATIRKRGKTYVLDWRDANGERHRESLGEITAAQARAALTRKKLELIGNPNRAAPVETVEEFSKKYLAWYKVQYPSSYVRAEGAFINYILPRFGATPLNMVQSYEVVTWVTSLVNGTAPFRMRNGDGRPGALVPMRGGLAPESANKVLKIFRAMFNRAIEWEVLSAVNPIGGKKVKDLKERTSKAPLYYTKAQLQVLYDHCSERNALMWKVIANTGLRRTEALQMMRAHAKGDILAIPSTNESPNKSAKIRHVPMNRAAKAAIEALAEIVGDGVYVFPRMYASSLSRLCKADLRRARLPGSIHTLRHTFAANLAMKDVPLRTIQVLMGHASIKTTEIYAHLMPSYLKQTTMKIDL